MSGIYIHIPFCKQACHYCDFHFSTNTKMVEPVLMMILKELELRQKFFTSDLKIETIYLGGGTPSLLSLDQLEKILSQIHQHYTLDIKEFTLEANPDDLNKEKLLGYKSLGIDRLSIGIQSFDDKVLSFYNRAHEAEDSLKVVDLAKSAGFEKLSIDLMYGFPHEDHSIWKNDLTLAMEIDPGHISSYALTVEPKTALGNWMKKGKFREASEDFQAEQFEMLMETMEKSGYIQYEISNFGKTGQFAIHNTNYWKAIPYLGIGPGAHSFDGKHRGYNIASNSLYIKELEKDKLPYTQEDLKGTDLANEYILTSLRTIWGTDLNWLKSNFDFDLITEKKELLKKLSDEKLILFDKEKLLLTKEGKLLADSIASALFF
ncbi:radical SAM family heme chaperone HemW [Shivajiella indica]|uniref:Heme chaperone HemW n=1 Tax=Shivajiella indica TaxID=872115 RepID=A0ABW5B5K6_9BACT